MLIEELHNWAEETPNWAPARSCRSLVRGLLGRIDLMRRRIDAPLVVATLGGTGTGKSTLVNALVGHDVTAGGRQRPTTRRPVVICHSDVDVAALGIDVDEVDLVAKDFPRLRRLVVIDCPDPDTTERENVEETNLARLRKVLPHCDVLLITATQQKYRSARVFDELARAATGARLLFVQTHAATDDDVRDDWRAALADRYVPGRIFRVDSLAARDPDEHGAAAAGDFDELLEMLTDRLSGPTGNQIRWANLLDLVRATLTECESRLQESMPAVRELVDVIDRQRGELATSMARRLESELLSSRRHWENRMINEVAGQWGMSPFSLVLRLYGGLGALIANASLLRVRSTAQLVIWGAWQGQQAVSRRRQEREASDAPRRAVGLAWDESQLESAALVVDGYAHTAGLPHRDERDSALADEASRAAGGFLDHVTVDLQELVSRLARNHAKSLSRIGYELALGVLLVYLVARLGWNFFYESWIDPASMYGTEFFLAAGFWLLAWCILLVGIFTFRLRRGLSSQLAQLTETWCASGNVGALFDETLRGCRAAEQFCATRNEIAGHVDHLADRLTPGPETLGRVR
ncbi:MAG: GTPase domain-containing protein [Pirellulales bacterium]